MGERFERGEAGGRSGEDLGLPEKLVAELAAAPIEEVRKLGDRFKTSSDSLIETAVKESKLVRYGAVTVEGLAYAVPGVLNGIHHNLTNLPETAFKIGTAATIGVGLRLLLPEKGAARALVGTTMGFFFVRDALHPFVEAYKEAGQAQDLAGVHKAAQKMGDGLGLFAVDSAVGIVVGVKAEKLTGRALKSSLGTKDYLAFEASKEAFWNSNKYVHGRALNWVAGKADAVTGALAERLIAKDSRRPMTMDEILARIDDVNLKAKARDEILARVVKAGQDAKSSYEDAGFYKYGPKVSEKGDRLGFSEMIDTLLAGKEPPVASGAKPHEFQVRPPFSRDGSLNPRRIAGDNPEVRMDAGKTPPHEIKAPAEAKPAETAAVEVKPVTGETARDLDPSTLAKAAAQAKKEQGTWSELAVQIADIKDGFASPIFSIRDGSRQGAMLPEEYGPSTRQLLSLIKQVASERELQEAGFVLDLHAKADAQDMLKLAGVIDLNLFARELHSILLTGLRRSGISDNVLESKVPSRVAITNDQGSGNFTIPSIDGVIDRPVTVFPRNQTGLLSVFAGINRHEQIGHDHVYGDLAKFPAELRDKLITDAVMNAMKEAKIADVDINVPGMGLVKKSDFFKKLLVAEANENTSDIMGTATGGADTALTLGVLLQSLRKGGQLETRNVLGKQFEDFIEPHGIDRWRIKLSAEVMRQLGNGDKRVENMANALDNYAARASRPGDSYVWASADEAHRGEFVSIPMKEWDAVIPHIVRAQLDTKLTSLEGRTFREILPNQAEIVQKIDTLGGYMADSVGKGSDTLVVPFDKTEFTIGQVFSAGLSGWLRAVGRGEDPGVALRRIDRISEGLRAQYRQGNPHEVPLGPSPIRSVVTSPIRLASDATGRLIQKQTALREGSARFATHMGSAATYLMMEDILRSHRLKAEMEAGAK